MKKDKFIAKTAKKIAELEKARYTKDDVSAIEAQITKISNELTMDELMEVDNYIYEHNLLTK